MAFKCQISAVAGPLFNAHALCGTVFSLSKQMYISWDYTVPVIYWWLSIKDCSWVISKD